MTHTPTTYDCLDCGRDGLPWSEMRVDPREDTLMCSNCRRVYDAIHEAALARVHTNLMLELLLA